MPHAYFPATRQQHDEPSWYASDISALHSMSLVSRRFSPLAQEVLYHEFIPGYGDSWYSHGYELYGRLESFLRTVAQSPDRGALVKRVYVNINLLNSIAEAQAEAVLKDAAQVRGIQLSDFVGPFRDGLNAFSRDQYRASGDELLGMLLAYLPHLETLSLSGGVPLWGVPAPALRAIGISTLRIETLDIYCCDEGLGCRLDGILELASSTITNLYINFCDSVGLRSLARPFPNLRNLCIANSKLSGSDLASFLSRRVGLVTFSYESSRSWIKQTVARYQYN